MGATFHFADVGRVDAVTAASWTVAPLGSIAVLTGVLGLKRAAENRGADSSCFGAFSRIALGGLVLSASWTGIVARSASGLIS